jgi:peptide-methionine (R)-S-oxide reductase
MNKALWFAILVMATLAAFGLASLRGQASTDSDTNTETAMTDETHGSDEKITRSNEEWKKILTPEEYHVLREEGTERAFSGEYWDEKRDGVYRCAGCGQVVFDSETKFDSGTGWPSFSEPADDDAIGTREDRSWFMTRTEVHCSRCGGHLGHVFDDGPQPTGLRYCINSVSLDFEKRADGGANEDAPTAERRPHER